MFYDRIDSQESPNYSWRVHPAPAGKLNETELEKLSREQLLIGNDQVFLKTASSRADQPLRDGDRDASNDYGGRGSGTRPSKKSTGAFVSSRSHHNNTGSGTHSPSQTPSLEASQTQSELKWWSGKIHDNRARKSRGIASIIKKSGAAGTRRQGAATVTAARIIQ